MFNLTFQHSRRPNAGYKALCISAQTVSLPRARMAVGREDLAGAQDHMLLIIGLVAALIAVVSIPRMRVSGAVNSANLGWMSQQWLAEHRASPAR